MKQLCDWLLSSVSVKDHLPYFQE
ncbi:hypothetical protein GEA64_03075 [Photorhabdus khanii]|uniref:WHIM1 domain-containing protein n=1 Tax=Photorhabdus khanii TaxID=1004150 RepID=A0A7C9GIT2_9GAMM|nr:hypothetical protein [Photorhabdus khanii]